VTQPEPPLSRTFISTAAAGLDTTSFPWRLWQKAKRLGIWDPAAIDFSQDKVDWARLAPDERDVLLRLSSLFQAGEEAVTVDLLPLIQVIARQGRLEEEIYLTSFLFEEAKHVELFRRFFDEVARERSDLSRYFTPSYRAIFADALPAALDRLRHDDSAESLAMASVTYNMIVEGVLAETGYRAYHAALVRNHILPGMQEGIQLTKRDESRHIAYGVFLLARLVNEGGMLLWDRIQVRMGELLEPAVAVIPEVFACYDPMPLGLKLEEFTDFAIQQFQARLGRIERAVRGDLVGATEGLDD
jgi:ribonucleoside-diphosphate reductase beta chain